MRKHHAWQRIPDELRILGVGPSEDLRRTPHSAPPDIVANPYDAGPAFARLPIGTFIVKTAMGYGRHPTKVCRVVGIDRLGEAFDGFNRVVYDRNHVTAGRALSCIWALGVGPCDHPVSIMGTTETGRTSWGKSEPTIPFRWLVHHGQGEAWKKLEGFRILCETKRDKPHVGLTLLFEGLGFDDGEYRDARLAAGSQRRSGYVV